MWPKFCPPSQTGDSVVGASVWCAACSHLLSNSQHSLRLRSGWTDLTYFISRVPLSQCVSATSLCRRQHCGGSQSNILQTTCGNFAEFTTLVLWGQRWTGSDFEFESQKVKGQGHSKTTYGQIRTLGGSFSRVPGMPGDILIKPVTSAHY